MSALTYTTLGYHETRTRVRFSEVDHYGYLWHGHVLSHFECLRMELARRFQFRTPDLFEADLILPMLETTCVYKTPAYEDEELLIQGTVLRPRIPDPFLVLDYRAIKAQSREEAFRGRTRQIFMRRDGRLATRIPEVMRSRLDQLWRYLERQPAWSEVSQTHRATDCVEAGHVT
jgi:acyl-CoA thioester hydrolase